ncbi:RNA polymerase I-specific transcription initiation factor RRN6-like protein [Nemania abortiva]|nr:RNA polymerase I-specific transcription initiation factor RRN6-like protein [Nemania abortiva]
MTERRLTESAIGLAGRLSHIPYATDKAEDCGWRSSRNFTRNAPVFRALGPCKTWIPADLDHATDSPQPLGTLWEQGRRQRTWLLNNHPEASLGNQLLHDLLAEENSPLAPQQEQSWHTCLVSLGELTDTTVRRKPGVPLVVTVTGSANNILRLTRLDHETWQWYRESNVAVRLAEVTTDKPVLWIEEDVGPIRRVKCIVDLKRYNPTRWLAVQRDSGTTIFQPESRKVPADSSPERYASRIFANPLFHLSKEQTGGSAHSDVAFNPGTRSNPPQLAIIDERGFWSIWDVGYTRTKHSGESLSRLRVCGHIDRGVLEHLPRRDRSDMKWHRVLWVGRSENSLDLLGNLDLDADNEELNSQTAFPPLQRSSLVLLCNPQQVKLLDLATGTFLPDLVFRRDDSLDCILDIQVAHDPQYFYVLSTSKLFIVRAYSRPGAEWDKPEKAWLILFSTPHFRSSFDQSPRLAITQAVKPDVATSLVFIHSSTNPCIDLFYVEFSPTDPNEVTCQANVTGLDSLQDATLNNAVRTLCINPAPIIVKETQSLTKIGHDLTEKKSKLYQIVALRPDMSLVSTLCIFSSSPATRIGVPSMKVGRSRIRRQGRRPARYLSSNFVVDDDSTTSEGDLPNATQRDIKAFYEHLSSNCAGPSKARPDGPAKRGFSVYNPFDAVHRSVQEGLENGILPIRTLLQVMPSFKQVSRQLLSATEWENEIGTLNDSHPSVSVHALDLLRPRPYFPMSASLQDVCSWFLEISNSSLHHRDSADANKVRIAAISEQIAYDLYLSLYGIGYRNLNSSQSQAAVEEDALLVSQTETLPSSPLRFESPASTTWSQMSNSEAPEDEDPAMSLIRAYTGTGKFVPAKRFELLDKWQLGAEPSEYTFDLDRSGDADMHRLRKAKQLAREDRKRRRAQTLLQLSQEPELPATQPAPDTRFFSSQPRIMSSQRQIIHSDPLYNAMSQPSAGPFGRRPNKKAKKRRGGF